MLPLKISQLPQFSGDSSGSYILINDASNSVTYIIKKEDFFSGSLYGTSSYALTASYAMNAGGGAGSGFPFSGSAVITGSLLISQSFVDFLSASYFLGNLTGSLEGTSSWAIYSVSSSVSKDSENSQLLNGLDSGALIKTGSSGTTQTISGSLIVNEGLTIYGSASIINITSSQLNIGTNLITVNTQNPTFRFGGLAVIDSGSSPQESGSILYDSVQDEWIFVHRGAASSVVTSSHFMMGPETYDDLGNELYIPANSLVKSVGNEHMTGSNLYDDGTNVQITSAQVSIDGALIVTGSLLSQGGFTGSLFGTSSWARNALTASYNYPISVSGSSLYSVSPTAGPGFNTQHSIFFGGSAGRLAYYANGSNFIGNQAGFWAYTASQSNFFGANAGFFAEKANNSNFIGAQSGQSATLAEKSNFFGYQAGAGAVSASYSTLIGFNVGSVWGNDYGKSIGRNNIVIGTMITLPYNYQNGINIGGIIFGSGSYFDSNNAGVSAFSGSANGRIGINQPDPQYSLDVSGSVYASQGFTGSLYGSSSYALTASYSVTASWALDADLTSSNAITRTNKTFQLGGDLIKTTTIDGDGAGSLYTPVSASSVVSASYLQLVVEDPVTKKIYVGGYPVTLNNDTGVRAFGLCRLNSDLTLDSSFNVGTGTSGSTFGTTTAIIVDKTISKIYVAGRFEIYSGSTVNHIVRLNEDGTIDTTFQTNGGATGGAGVAAVRGIWDAEMDSSGKIVAVGNFTLYSGSTNNYIVRINQDGTQDATFNNATGFNASGTSVGLDKSGNIYVAGVFTNYKGVGANRVIGLNPDGTRKTAFNVGTGLNASPGQPILLTTPDDKVLVTGDAFTAYSGSTANRIVRINQDGTLDSTFKTGGGFSGWPGIAAVDHLNRIYAGNWGGSGGFTYSGSAFTGSIRILPNGSVDATYNRRGSGYTSIAPAANGIQVSPYSGKRSVYVTSSNDYALIGNYAVAYNGVTGSVFKVYTDYFNLNLSSSLVNYDQDYSYLYNDRTLVDKAYVDNKFTGSFFSGSIVISGSLQVSGSVTGSLFGTSSWSNNSVTASFVTLAQTASFVTTAQTASFVATASWANNARTASFITTAQTASYVLQAVSSSFASTASFVTTAQTASFVTTAQTASFVATASWARNAITSSFITTAQTASFVTLAQTASFVTTAQTASFVTTAQTASFVSQAQTASFVATASWAINALTASSADSIVVRQSVTASNVLVTGTITAQTLITQVVTSSTSFVTGSTIFGSLSTDTHQFTGSVIVSGSVISPQITGSLFGTSSWAESSSLSLDSISSSYSLQATSSSYAATASSADNFVVRQEITASNALITGTITADTIIVQTFISSSGDTISGSTKFGSLLTDTHQFTGSVFITGSLTSPNMYGTASWAQNAVTVQDQNFAIVYAVVL